MFVTDDVRHLLPRSKEIRCIALRDRLIDCRLQIHCLAEGSLDPLVVSIFEQLFNGPVSITSLTSSAGGKGRAGLRAIAQALTALQIAGEVQVEEYQGTTMCKLTNSSTWSRHPSQERIVESAFQYVPRSRHFDRYIPGKYWNDLPELCWWNPPDEQELYYPGENLSASIVEACSLYHSNSSVRPNLIAKQPREETLQRSFLLSVELRFLSASLINQNLSDLWNIHRCFLCKSDNKGTDRWSIFVYRYPRGPRQPEYGQYFEQLRQVNPDAVEELIDLAETL
jgi:hypothetical protein